MSKYLFIVESPNKCAKIKSFLGDDYKVMASVGHIMEIPKKGLNIDVQNGFEPTYEIKADKKSVVSEIKEAAKKAEKIYLATDSDREGAGIAYHIYKNFDKECKKKCVRVTFLEITKKAIEAAIKAPQTIESQKDLIAAQKARQVMDRLIGYKVSPILWRTVGAGTSAGRVQSIALKIICLRDKEIQDFKPQDYWYIDALLKTLKDEQFKARVITKDKDNRYLDEPLSIADCEKLKKAAYKVGAIERKEKVNNAYPPFDTASLQTSCASVFGWPVKKTAMFAQKLYEQGLVTYIRTDSFNIAQESIDEAKKYIKVKFGDAYLPDKPNVYAKKSKAAAQEAHECIRPTHCTNEGEDISDCDEAKLYKFIRDRFVACQMKPMLVDTVVYNIDASSGHKLLAKGQSVKFDGWQKAYPYSTTKEEILPAVSQGETLKLIDLDRSKHTTKPPDRYNEGSLVKKMESEGVGRPSTYPTIMDSIQKKGYVEALKAKKGALQATALGMRVFEYLEPSFNKDFFMDIQYTAGLEDKLDKIANGEETFLAVIEKAYKELCSQIKTAQEKTGTSSAPTRSMEAPCPVCKKGGIIERAGKFGKFFTCSGYPECKSIFIQKEDGTFVVKEKKETNATDTGTTCPRCKKGKIVMRTGQYGDWYTCNAFPRCRANFIKNENGSFSVKEKKEWKKKGSSRQDDASSLVDV